MTKARIAGFFYLLVFITGGLALSIGGKFVVRGNPSATATNILAHATAFQLGWAVGLIATACYIVVTALFYDLFRPVNRTLSLTAAFFSVVGCAIGTVSVIFQIAAPLVLKDTHYASTFTLDQTRAMAFVFLRLSTQLSNIALVFFGFYCLSIGFLILGANFLPRILGAGMLLAGLGWLTFLWPPLTNYLAPYNFLPGMIGEASLTLWLLVMGVNAARWQQQLIAIPEHV
jgi:hypothetical protein